jgi:hypothetical protein
MYRETQRDFEFLTKDEAISGSNHASFKLIDAMPPDGINVQNCPSGNRVSAGRLPCGAAPLSLTEILL